LLGLLLKIKKMTGDLQRPSAKIEDAIPTAITFRYIVVLIFLFMLSFSYHVLLDVK